LSRKKRQFAAPDNALIMRRNYLYKVHGANNVFLHPTQALEKILGVRGFFGVGV